MKIVVKKKAQTISVKALPNRMKQGCQIRDDNVADSSLCILKNFMVHRRIISDVATISNTCSNGSL